ncbi:MAG: aminotransferase class III-fold pyridoxal phosphate-dependent enzyme [Pseudomonadota bacterium]
MSPRKLNYWQPMTHPAATAANPPREIVAAEGVRITDARGQSAIDAVGGLWNVNLGYSNSAIKAAISRQLDVLPYYSSFTGVATDTAIDLADRLIEWFAPESMGRVFYTSGGSDSIETALRLARQIHKLRGDKDRTKFISLKKGYHGTHFGGSSINGNAKFRRNYEPLLPGCFQISCPLPYRNPFDETDPKRLAQLCAAQLDDEIRFQGPDTVAAFIMEPVLGAGGVIVPHETFMPMVRDICDRHGVLLIADEVITAFGRTGAWTGSRLWNVKPDLMCIAKAITNGYFPFGATLIAEHIVPLFESNQPDASGDIGHGYTYSGHPVGAAAGLATLDQIDQIDVAAKARARGVELQQGLAELSQRYDIVGDVRGVGLMAAVEIVSDAAAKTPMDKATLGKLDRAAYDAGTLVRISGNVVILSPPLILSSQDVLAIISALDAGLAAASA